MYVIHPVSPLVDNDTKPGFWKTSPALKGLRFRIVNQTAKCTPPAFLIFEAETPEEEGFTANEASFLSPIAVHNYVDEEGYVRVYMCNGTLVPADLRQCWSACIPQDGVVAPAAATEEQRASASSVSLPAVQPAMSAEALSGLLVKAAAEGDAERLKQLLKVPSADVNQVDEHGLTPMIAASQNRHSECVGLLLEAFSVGPIAIPAEAISSGTSTHASPRSADASSEEGGASERNPSDDSERPRKQPRASWSAEEDAAIVRAVSIHGYRWDQVITELPNGRSADSVRNRWQKLRPLVPDTQCPKPRPHASGPQLSKNGTLVPGWVGWSAAEDATILEYVATNGPRWRKIAALLPGRSESSVRNRHVRLAGGAVAAGTSQAAVPPTTAAAPAAALSPATDSALATRVSATTADEVTVADAVVVAAVPSEEVQAPSTALAELPPSDDPFRSITTAQAVDQSDTRTADDILVDSMLSFDLPPLFRASTSELLTASLDSIEEAPELPSPPNSPPAPIEAPRRVARRKLPLSAPLTLSAPVIVAVLFVVIAIYAQFSYLSVRTYLGQGELSWGYLPILIYSCYLIPVAALAKFLRSRLSAARFMDLYAVFASAQGIGIGIGQMTMSAEALQSAMTEMSSASLFMTFIRVQCFVAALVFSQCSRTVIWKNRVLACSIINVVLWPAAASYLRLGSALPLARLALQNRAVPALVGFAVGRSLLPTNKLSGPMLIGGSSRCTDCTRSSFRFAEVFSATAIAVNLEASNLEESIGP